jgi:small subunit ribosomal protein S20
MPNLKQAEKALRQSKVRAARNKVMRDELDSLRTKMRKLVSAKKTDEAREMMKLLDAKLDKAAKKNIFSKNKAARIKSRTMAKVNAK